MTDYRKFQWNEGDIEVLEDEATKKKAQKSAAESDWFLFTDDVLAEGDKLLENAKKAVEKGGEGSGNFGHAGRPGEIGGSAAGGGGGGAFNEKVPVKWIDGTRQKETVLVAAQDPVMYHGGYTEDAKSIAQGIRASEDGTAGPGVYLTDVSQDAIYERDPNRSAGVKAHGGKQPNHVYETRVQGKVLDVGVMDSKNGPSVYLRPDIYAAVVLEGTVGRHADIGALIGNPGAAGKIIESHGFSGIAWTFGGGDRRGAVIFNPVNVTVAAG